MRRCDGERAEQRRATVELERDAPDDDRPVTGDERRAEVIGEPVERKTARAQQGGERSEIAGCRSFDARRRHAPTRSIMPIAWLPLSRRAAPGPGAGPPRARARAGRTSTSRAARGRGDRPRSAAGDGG